MAEIQQPDFQVGAFSDLHSMTELLTRLISLTGSVPDV